MINKTSRLSVFGPLSKSAYFALIFATLFTQVGCGSDSPTGLAEQPIILTGLLAYQGSEVLNFTLDDDEIIRIDIVELTPVLVDITNNPNFVPTIGFGLGTPLEGACITTQRSAAQEGGFFIFGLNAGNYCLRLSDTGFFPEDAIVKYTLSISSSA